VLANEAKTIEALAKTGEFRKKRPGSPGPAKI
jgi:hypothetical protein